MTERKIYIRTYIALMALLVLTIASTSIELGAFNLLANLGIAAAKALLIVLFFMHLWESSTLIRLFAVGSFFWIFIMFGLSLGDYSSRPEPGSMESFAEPGEAVTAPPSERVERAIQLERPWDQTR